MSLYGGLPYKDRLDNDIYTDFRNMQRLEEILDDPDYTELEKMLGSLVLFYGEDIPNDLEAAYGELLWFYYRGEEPEKPKKRIEKLFDFQEDAAYFAGSFLSAYGIDLTDEDTYINWWRFMALLLSLPDSTTLMKRMCDRNVDTSKMKGEMRKHYEERKNAVALKSVKRRRSASPEERKREKQKRLDELYAQAEREQAERGDKDAKE